MKRSLSTCIAVSVLAALALSGCAGSADSTSEPVSENTVSEQAAQAEEAAAEKSTATEETTEAANVEGALADSTYTATALTTHFASNCAAGIDYDSLYDIAFTVENGVFASIDYDIGANAKEVPETADVSMEDWPFIKLSETQARANLIGQPATKDAIINAWQLEKREELAEQGIDATSGATEACRATRDAIVNITAMNESGNSYDEVYNAKDAVPQIVMFSGTVIDETVQENGRISKTVQVDDGDYTMYGVVSATNNEIDNTAVDYNYIIEVKVSVADGKIKSIDCTTPNGSASSKEAVAEADEIAKSKLVGIDATNTAISENLPYNSRSEEPFEGSIGAQIACDMISSVLKNGYTHIIGWNY